MAAKIIKTFRVRLMLGNNTLKGIIQAYTAKQAAAYWARNILRDPSLRYYVEAEEVDECFIGADRCPFCGLADPMVASGEINCPNCS